MAKEYEVFSKIQSLSFLNGYSCKSENEDYFLRHIGYRFSNLCNMYTLNNAYKCGDLLIRVKKPFDKEYPSVWPKDDRRNKPNIINEYWGVYGYIIEINHGTVEYPIIETRSFVNDIEANEWKDSHI